MVFPGQSGLIPMWVADMDFPCADEIVRAIQERASHPVYGYSHIGSDFGGPAARWVKKRHDWKISANNVTFCHGVVPALAACIMSLTEPKDDILIQQPVYYPFRDIIEKNGRTFISNDLYYDKMDACWKIDFEDFEKKIADASVFMLCNPHNPVGRVYTKEELTRMGELCLKHHTVILSDEIHSDLVYKHAKHIPIASLSDALSQQTITKISPSKAFNIAGLQTACVISENEEYLKKFQLEMEKSMNVMNLFGPIAYQAAYDECEDYVDELVDYLWDNYCFLEEYFQKEMPLIQPQKPEATYLIWLDCSKMGISGDEIYDFFVNMAGIAIDNGIWFGENGKNFARLNIASPRSMLQEALIKLKHAYDQLVQGKN
jgi:cystathionine beta-lyase